MGAYSSRQLGPRIYGDGVSLHRYALKIFCFVLFLLAPIRKSPRLQQSTQFVNFHPVHATVTKDFCYSVKATETSWRNSRNKQTNGTIIIWRGSPKSLDVLVSVQKHSWSFGRTVNSRSLYEYDSMSVNWCGFKTQVWSTIIKPITAFSPTNRLVHSYSNRATTWWAQVNVGFTILYL